MILLVIAIFGAGLGIQLTLSFVGLRIEHAIVDLTKKLGKP